MTVHEDELDPLVRGSREHYADARYYDHAYRTRTDDIEFYRRLVRKLGSPVLDVGGGSGRVALALARDGADVTVLDLSAPMLARARSRAVEVLGPDARRLHFVRADMRRFSVRRRFPTIIAPFNVLQHLYEPQDFQACFERIAAHLERSGTFAFDVRMPVLSELARDPARWYRSRGFVHPTSGLRVRYSERFRYDPVKQVQHVTLRFEPDANRGAGMDVLLTQRQIFPNELRALLALGGLRVASRLGDFDGSAFRGESTQQIVLARPTGPR